MEDYEKMTPEEIEWAREQRRRKRAARERRRRKRRQQAIIRCSILLLIVILLLVGIVKLISGVWKHFHKAKEPASTTEQMATTEETTEAAQIDDSILARDMPADREAALTALKELAASDPDIQSICDNAAVYPDIILQTLVVMPDMKQFVLDYPSKISIAFDGDFTADFTPGEVPLYIQYDEQWGYADYGNNIVAISGCGPTCLSMACVYLQQDGTMNPIKVADYSTEHGYVTDTGDTSWSLMTDGATGLGLTSEELSMDENAMISALDNGKVIICSMNPGDFTKSGHFILIRAYKDGLFYVNDPSSTARSEVGWDFTRLSSQISNMWAIGKGE